MDIYDIVYIWILTYVIDKVDTVWGQMRSNINLYLH